MMAHVFEESTPHIGQLERHARIFGGRSVAVINITASATIRKRTIATLSIIWLNLPNQGILGRMTRYR